MKILLVCSAGMSTSLLVNKMTKAAQEQGIDAEILAHSVADSKRFLDQVDIILLGPQVRFLKAEMEKNSKVPVQVIDMMAYGRMDGGRVLENALKELNQG